MAHFRIIRNYMKAVADADAEGLYTVELTSMGDGRLKSSCACSTAIRDASAGLIKRVLLEGHAQRLQQEDVIPSRLHAKPGRKRTKPYQPSESTRRKCLECGGQCHFSSSCPNPVSAHLSQWKRQKIIEAADQLVVDLSEEREGDVAGFANS